MKIKISLVDKESQLPYKAHPTDAGWDLFVRKAEADMENKVITYHLGVCVAIPEGHVGLLFPRSSIYKKGLKLANSVGILDHDFNSELQAKFYFKPGDKLYSIGDRCCQLIVIPIPNVEFELVDKLDGKRGGFGSTNIK